MTLGELHLGVLMASTGKARAQRLRTLAGAEARFEPLPVDGAVVAKFAELVAESRSRGWRPTVVDTLIAATAVAHDMPVYTQDAGFDRIAGVEVVQV